MLADNKNAGISSIPCGNSFIKRFVPFSPNIINDFTPIPRKKPLSKSKKKVGILNKKTPLIRNKHTVILLTKRSIVNSILGKGAANKVFFSEKSMWSPVKYPNKKAKLNNIVEMDNRKLIFFMKFIYQILLLYR